MGDEIKCTATVDGAPRNVRALLESDEIILRGEVKLRIPIASIAAMEADDEALHIDHPGGRVSLAIGGARAQRWRDRILHPKSRVEKLGVKPSLSVDVVNVPGLADELEQAGTPGPVDLLFVGIADRGALDDLPHWSARVQEKGAIWIVRPRGGPLKEAEVRETFRAAGWVDVKVVRFSETHTADKFSRRRP